MCIAYCFSKGKGWVGTGDWEMYGTDASHKLFCVYMVFGKAVEFWTATFSGERIRHGMTL